MESSRRDLLNNMAEHRNISITKMRTTPLFFKIDLCLAASMGSSRRDLLNDVAEHRSILKNYQSTRCTRFSFTPITGIAFPKTGSLFLLRLGFVPWSFASLPISFFPYATPRIVAAAK